MGNTDVARTETNSREKPIKLLLVAPALRILGGQAVQANYLLEHLGREPDFEVSFVPHNPQLPGPFRFLQSIKYVRTLVTSFIYCLNLLIQVPRHDIVHTFSASYLSFLLAPTPAILIARLFGKKVILNYRSGEAEDHLRTWPRTSVPIMKLADELIVPSQYLVDVFRKFGLRASAVANIIDQSRFKYRERKPLLPIFFSNRNLYPLYNVACILRAFAKIQQRFPEATLIIAGDGSQRASLEALARELKLQNVDFRGRVNPAKMNELYDEARPHHLHHRLQRAPRHARPRAVAACARTTDLRPTLRAMVLAPPPGATAIAPECYPRRTAPRGALPRGTPTRPRASDRRPSLPLPSSLRPTMTRASRACASRGSSALPGFGSPTSPSASTGLGCWA